MMKRKNKKLVRIFAGVVAIALIGGILFITNAFVGNPISAMMANKAIQKYVNENYSFLDLEVEKATYNFKDSSYFAMAKSRTSIDTQFAIYYQSGKVQRDDYEGYVVEKFNTLTRLSEEYSFIAKSIIARELGYENNTTMVMFDMDDHERNMELLELDMKFDKAIPIDAEVTIRLDLQDYSIETLAKVLTDAHQAFVDNDCHFYKYGLYAENNDTYVMVNDVSPADIESGELVNLLEEAKHNDNPLGISVFIKE